MKRGQDFRNCRWKKCETWMGRTSITGITFRRTVTGTSTSKQMASRATPETFKNETNLLFISILILITKPLNQWFDKRKHLAGFEGHIKWSVSR